MLNNTSHSSAKPERLDGTCIDPTARCAVPNRKDAQRSEAPWRSSKQSLLVILHYLLKNNTTFMGGCANRKSSGGSNLRHMSSHMGPLLTIGGSLR